MRAFQPGSRGGGGFPDLAHLAVGRPVAVDPVHRLGERVEQHLQGLQDVASVWIESGRSLGKGLMINRGYALPH